MKRIRIELEPYQLVTLEQMRDRHPRPYLREKAAAILKVAAGETVEEVAQKGLLKRRKVATVRGWVKSYRDQGLGGLYQQQRRKRDFSP
jgi:transposase